MKRNILAKIRKGFTLIEMLIVIVIIGILLGVLIKNYTGVQAKARNTAKMIAVKNISDGLIRYQGDENTYPDALSALSVYGKTVDATKYQISYKKIDNHYILCAKMEKEGTNANANATSCPTTFDANFTEASSSSKSSAGDSLYYVVQE